jgi:hypothetical protein
MGALMPNWLRAAGMALFLTACGPEDFTTWATVTAVQEVETAEAPETSTAYDDDLRLPQPGFRLELQLEDGATLSVEQKRNRRYEPGERVRLIRDAEGDLLL